MSLLHMHRGVPVWYRTAGHDVRMKRCSRCGRALELSEFNRSGGSPDGLHGYCRECQKQHYRENKARHGRNVRKTTRARIAAIRRVTAAHLMRGCVDCGIADLRVLSFDHVRGTKVDHVSRMIRRGRSLASIRLEIAKCDVRCHNCHAIATAERRGHSWFDDYVTGAPTPHERVPEEPGSDDGAACPRQDSNPQSAG